jgi:hypothetical protein
VLSSVGEVQAESKHAISKIKKLLPAYRLITGAEGIYGYTRCNHARTAEALAAGLLHVADWMEKVLREMGSSRLVLHGR